MKNITKIHLLKAKFLSLLQPQSVLQKMRVSTGSVLFQTTDAVLQHFTIKRPCHCLCKRLMLVLLEGCLCKFSCIISIYLILPIKPVQGNQFFLSYTALPPLCIIPQFSGKQG